MTALDIKAPVTALGGGESAGLAAVLLRLHRPALVVWALLVTVTSALPTAQNVFVYASSYDRGTLLARDVVLLTTVLSVPVLVVLALVLG